MEIKGRIIKKINSKNNIILIIHGENRYRAMLSKSLNINYYDCNTGDLVKIKGKKMIGKYSDHYIEIIIEQLLKVKDCLLNNLECGLTKETKFNKSKENKFFHTKMIMDTKVIDRIKINSKIYTKLRNVLETDNFIECRTPILNNTYQGGTSLPFKTYTNYKHKECYLRPNSFRPLMMYITGGIDRVYEIGEYFRNGSIGKMSSVPYTALELYATDMDYSETIEYAIKIFCQLMKVANYNLAQNKKIEKTSFSEYMKNNEFKKFELEKLNEYFDYKKIEFKEDNYHNINNLYKIFKEEIICRDFKPKIIYDMPTGISPFIDKSVVDPYVLKRAFLIFKGYTVMEITFSKNDYNYIVEQLQEQEKISIDKNDNKKKTVIQEGYMHALKMGILPTSSITISIERLISLICDDKDINEYKIII